jgi:Spx/MgsR family transcriptional regulator
MIQLYGLTHCSTCRKAMTWLEGHGIAYRFSDYREHPIAGRDLVQYARQIGWERLVNRASTSWRALSDAEKTPGSDAEWLALVERFPTLIRRPLMVTDKGDATSGFSAGTYAVMFGK